ncbi:MAG: ABC transporter permease, partial [Gemmatimonadaceae bacterium]
HIDAHAAELVSRGVSDAEARREARRRFGGATGLRDDVRDAEGLRPWDALSQYLRFAFRSVRRAPGFTAMAVLTLGLGIGANGAMFGIVDRLMLRGPEGVTAPGQLRRAYVANTSPAFGESTTDFQPYAFYALLRDHVPAFAAVGASTRPDREPLGRGAQPVRVDVVHATSDFFTTLGVRPFLGRFYDATEDRPEHAAAVGVLGYGLWSGAFGGDSAIVGHTVTLGGRQITIVGVAPRGFTGAKASNVDVWLPMGGENMGKDWPTTWNWTGLHVVARLKPGVAVRVANAQATAALHAGYTGQGTAMRSAGVSLRPISYDDSGIEPAEFGVARMLWGMALVVLLIASTNITNLLLARSARRRRELGVRVALGAGRARLAGMLFSEAALIAVLGGVAGVAVAYWGGALIRRTLLPT